MAQQEPIAYQCQLPKPCLQYPQSFKQEHHDPQYEQANQAGSSQQYPAAVVVKQEQVDYVYDSGRQSWLFLTQWGEQLLGEHPSLLVSEL